MIYTVTFNPAIDYVVRLDGRLELGGINRNCEETVCFGGKGINVSVVLHELGQDTVALGFIAGFTGEGLEKGLREQGIPTDFIRVREGLTRINVKLKADRETEINGIGPRITQDDLQRLYRQLDGLTAEDYLVLSGSVPSCLGMDTYEKLLAYLSLRNVPVVVDAAKDLLLNALKHRPFLIKPNHHELGEIFGTVLNDQAQIAEYAKRLQTMGARNVLVSMAGDGAFLLDEAGNTYRISCPQGQLVNSVGAGDSMVAGFLAGYLQTGDYVHALRLGTAAGSATAFSVGLADRNKITELLKQL